MFLYSVQNLAIGLNSAETFLGIWRYVKANGEYFFYEDECSDCMHLHLVQTLSFSTFVDFNTDKYIFSDRRHVITYYTRVSMFKTCWQQLLNVQNPVTGNEKTLRKPKRWKHSEPITREQLKQMRDEFWDTAPYYGGQKGAKS